MPIYKYQLENGEVRYMVKVNIGPKQYLKRGFRIKKSAEAYERDLKDKHQFGLSGKDPNIKIESLANKFLTDYVEVVRKERTYDDYKGVIDNHIVPYFEGRKVASISNEDVQGFVKAKRDEGLAPRTIEKFIAVLSKMFSQAIKWGYVRTNPAQNIDKPRKPRKEMLFYSPQEVKSLFNACEAGFLPHIATAVLTGVRQGELIALKWGDINFEREVIHINRSFSGGYLTEPKSYASSRTVVMSPKLKEILIRYKESVNPSSSDELVFPGKDGDYMTPEALVYRFKKTYEKAGLKRVRWHDLRHTYAALMFHLGESLVLVQRQMGHSQPSTTLNKYGHLLPETSAGVGSRIDALVFNEQD